MAKKTAKKDESATPTKAPAKDSAKSSKKAPAAEKATAPAAKSAAPKASAPKASAAKTAAPKAGAVKTTVPKAAAPKAAKPKAAAVKLTDSQKDMLNKVHSAGDAGYEASKQLEERSLTALVERKLIKKGAKNKASGKVSHTVSAAGKKHIESQGSGTKS